MKEPSGLVAQTQSVAPITQRGLAESVREQLWFGDDDPERVAIDASRSLAAALARANGLKPFPGTAQRAMQLLSDPSTPLRAIREAMEQDPVITAGVLRLANSAIYRSRQAIASIDEAVQRLGVRHVLESVAGVAAMGMFKDAKGVGREVKDHSARVGAITRVLASEWHQRSAENPFLCGLLHDVGKLLLLQVGEADSADLASHFAAGGDEACGRERPLLGYDHAVLGGHVLDCWKLPAGVAEVVAWHHQPGRAFAHGGELGLGVALVRIANRIEHEMQARPVLNASFIEELSLDGSVSYTGYNSSILSAMWPKLREAAAQACSAVG